MAAKKKVVVKKKTEKKAKAPAKAASKKAVAAPAKTTTKPVAKKSPVKTPEKKSSKTSAKLVPASSKKDEKLKKAVAVGVAAVAASKSLEIADEDLDLDDDLDIGSTKTKFATDDELFADDDEFVAVEDFDFANTSTDEETEEGEVVTPINEDEEIEVEEDQEGPPSWWKSDPRGMEGGDEAGGDLQSDFDDSDEWTEDDDWASASKKSDLYDDGDDW